MGSFSVNESLSLPISIPMAMEKNIEFLAGGGIRKQPA
jgi:hypothetical protein